MTPLEQQILAAVRSAPAGISESSLEASLGQAPGVGGMHPEIIATALRRLRAAGQIRRSDDGLYALIQTAAAQPAPVQPTTGDEPMAEAKTKTCSKCGSTDFTDTGKCKACTRLYNQAYAAKKLGGVAA